MPSGFLMELGEAAKRVLARDFLMELEEAGNETVDL